MTVRQAGTKPEPKSSAAAANKGGAPKGNKNAMKHGLYASRMTQDEMDILGGMKVTELESEIGYMRVVCGRIALILEHNGLESNATKLLSEGALRTLSALDKTLTTLMTYIRQYALLTGEMPDLEVDIETGKDLARIKHDVYRYLEPGK